MKTYYTLITFIFLFSSSLFGQIEYKGTVDAKYKIMQLDDGTFKYLRYNKKLQEVSIFNLENTLWRTVKLPLPDHHHLDEIKSVSVHTFNNDELVELVYSCVEYEFQINEDPDNEHVIVNFTLNIINEKGELILKVTDSNEMEIIRTNKESKLLVYKHIGQGFDSKDETLIYSLPHKK